MSCKQQGLVGMIWDISTPALVRGADAFVVTQVVFQGTSSPYSFQAFTGSTAYFPGVVDGVPVAVVGTLVSADLGQVRFNIPKTASTGLALGDEVSFQQDLVDSRGLTRLIFEAALPVVDTLF